MAGSNAIYTDLSILEKELQHLLDLDPDQNAPIDAICSTIERLLFDSFWPNQENSVNTHIANTALKAMVKHKESAEANYICFCILEKLSIGRPDDFLHHVIAKNGLDIIMHSMRNFQKEPDIQISALKLAACLCASVGHCLLEDNCAIEIIFSSLQRYDEWTEFQNIAIPLLLPLENPSTVIVEKFVESGGVSIIIRLMARLSRCIRTQRISFSAVTVLCGESELGREIFGRLGGINLLLQAMSNNKNDLLLQESGCVALNSATIDNNVNLGQAGEAGAITVVMKAIRRFRKKESIAHISIVLLCRFAGYMNKYATDIVEADGIDTILGTMIYYRSTEYIHRDAIQLIATLLRQGEDFKFLIKFKGAKRIISAVLQTHIHNSELIEDGVKVLRLMK